MSCDPAPHAAPPPLLCAQRRTRVPAHPDPPLTCFPARPLGPRDAPQPPPHPAPAVTPAPRHRPASPLCPASSFRAPSTRAPRSSAPRACLRPGSGGAGPHRRKCPGAGGRDLPGGWEPWAEAAAGAAVAAVAAPGRRRGGRPGARGRQRPAERGAMRGAGTGTGARRWRWRCRCCCCCSLGSRLPPLATAERAVSGGPAGPIPGARAGAMEGKRPVGGGVWDCDSPGDTCALTWQGRRPQVPHAVLGAQGAP